MLYTRDKDEQISKLNREASAVLKSCTQKYWALIFIFFPFFFFLFQTRHAILVGDYFFGSEQYSEIEVFAPPELELILVSIKVK